MFLHEHPYKPFITHSTKKLIVGTLPPPRFSTGELLPKDVDFCYGSYYNSLWLYIDEIHQLGLRYDHSKIAVNQRKTFLKDHHIGVCDIVQSCEREKIDASDLGMQNVQLRDVVGYLRKYPRIDTLLFTGGNSKNGPEYFFRKHLKTYQLNLNVQSSEVPRIHHFKLGNRIIKTVSLTSCSGAANISISRLPLYRQLKAKNPDFNTFDFRVMQYREFF
ncbi:uracil-DNA glycosylase family protein [Psychroserpens sp. BH13MA-6]